MILDNATKKLIASRRKEIRSEITDPELEFQSICGAVLKYLDSVGKDEQTPEFFEEVKVAVREELAYQ